jgi:hypothetical protein
MGRKINAIINETNKWLFKRMDMTEKHVVKLAKRKNGPKLIIRNEIKRY